MQVVPGEKCNYLGGIIDEYDYFNESIVYCGNCVYRNSAGAEHSEDSFHGRGTGKMDAEKIRLGMGIGLLVVAVVFYTAIMFIRDYMKRREPKKAAKSIPAKAE